MRFFREVWWWAEEGRQHDIPTCCGIRFGISCERPKPIARFFPRFAVRVRDTLSLRLAFAAQDQQGWVPCEAHLALYALTGYKPKIKQDYEG